MASLLFVLILSQTILLNLEIDPEGSFIRIINMLTLWNKEVIMTVILMIPFLSYVPLAYTHI